MIPELLLKGLWDEGIGIYGRAGGVGGVWDGDGADAAEGDGVADSGRAGGAGVKKMIIGALWCIGGTAVTVATYSAASNGGSYVVAWGAVLFGAIQFWGGLVQAIRS